MRRRRRCKSSGIEHALRYWKMQDEMRQFERLQSISSGGSFAIFTLHFGAEHSRGIHEPLKGFTRCPRWLSQNTSSRCSTQRALAVGSGPRDTSATILRSRIASGTANALAATIPGAHAQGNPMLYASDRALSCPWRLANRRLGRVKVSLSLLQNVQNREPPE
jgi:hypothetical protein